MRQLCLPARLPEHGGEVEIEGADYHHLVRVLRLRVGDRIDAVDASGRRAEARIVRVGREKLTLEAHSAVIGADVDRASVSEIAVPSARRLATSAPH